MSLPKVLVGVVTYEGKDYVWDKFYNNIKNFSYPDFEVMIVDNSRTKKYYLKLKKRTKEDKRFHVHHVSRGDTSREAQAKSLNKIRDYALENDFDYFLSLESDLIPPRDVIERLISHNKQVVGCVYLIGYADSEAQPPRPCLFGHNGKDGTKNLTKEQGYGMFGTGVQPIHGCGIGVTLIHKSILQKIRFWYILDKPVKHSDVLFFMDYHNKGYQAYVDTDMIIPHYNSKWDHVVDK